MSQTTTCVLMCYWDCIISTLYFRFNVLIKVLKSLKNDKNQQTVANNTYKTFN